MEDSTLTEATLGIVRRAHARTDLRGSIGVVIQAYLYRSTMMSTVYIREESSPASNSAKEPPEVAYAHKADVDANYVRLSKKLLNSPLYHGLLMHDEKYDSLQPTSRSAISHRTGLSVRCSTGCAAICSGNLWQRDTTRVYVPFGREWYTYHAAACGAARERAVPGQEHAAQLA